MEITEARENHIPEIVELWKEFMDFHRDIDPRFPMRKDAHTNWEKHGFKDYVHRLYLDRD